MPSTSVAGNQKIPSLIYITYHTTPHHHPGYAQLKTLLACNPKDYHNIMVWAACCVAFFGCLHCSKFTVPDQTSYDPTNHLSYDDVSIDNKVSPRMILLHIKQSKTDATRQGAQVVLGVTGKDICPVKALLPYLVIRRAQPGPLFITPDNHHLTQPLFRSMLHSLLKQVGLRAEQFNTHSFRIDCLRYK